MRCIWNTLNGVGWGDIPDKYELLICKPLPKSRFRQGKMFSSTIWGSKQELIKFLYKSSSVTGWEIWYLKSKFFGLPRIGMCQERDISLDLHALKLNVSEYNSIRELFLLVRAFGFLTTEGITKPKYNGSIQQFITAGLKVLPEFPVSPLTKIVMLVLILWPLRVGAPCQISSEATIWLPQLA